jgi:hypothetical protein
MDISEDVTLAAMMACEQYVRSGEMSRANAGMNVATTGFATALEIGLRAALMDPIGAQLIVDHLNETAEIMSAQLEEANQIIASDARKLLEAVARQTS